MTNNHFALTKTGISEIPTGVSGCYVIYFASFPAKFYIGSSKSLRSRLQAHRRNLEQNKHKNKQLRVLSADSRMSAGLLSYLRATRRLLDPMSNVTSTLTCLISTTLIIK